MDRDISVKWKLYHYAIGIFEIAKTYRQLRTIVKCRQSFEEIFCGMCLLDSSLVSSDNKVTIAFWNFFSVDYPRYFYSKPFCFGHNCHC